LSVRLNLSVGLIAGAALAYQLLLMRLLGIVHWQPFVALILSLALLGHGASGTWLALRGHRAAGGQAYPLWALGFALTAPACWALAQRLPFNGLELIWDARQLLWLSALFLLLGLPFFCAANCLGLALLQNPRRIGSVYAADLVGAGLGVVAVMLLLYRLPPQDGLRGVALAAVLGAALILPQRRHAAALALLGLVAALSWPERWLLPQPTSFKALPRTLLLPGARIVAERHSPLGWLAVVESPQVPLRQVPGLSLLNLQEPAPQLGVFVDGDSPGTITRRSSDPAALAYLGRTTGALPYALLQQPRVLVLAAGSGGEVLQALVLGASKIVAVEANPQFAELLRGPYAEWSGGLYRDPRVEWLQADPRHALRRLPPGFDLIQLAPTDSAGGSAAGVQAAAESSLYTQEALREAHALLAPGGWLALTRWSKQPPRDSLKLLATAAAMLRAEGVEPAAQLAMIRGWQTDTLLVRRGVIAAPERAAIRRYCADHGFDLVALPGLRAEERNRYNRLREDHLSAGADALLGPRAEAYIDDYKFDIRPARDGRPFFHNHFRWRSLPEIWHLRSQGGAVLLDAGYLLVLAALLQALPLALLLVLLPWWRRRGAAPAADWRRAGLYFLCLGLGFLFIEVAALSRIGLLLGQPLLAATLVLAAMLVFAGLGSACSPSLAGQGARACLAVGLLTLLLGALQPLLFDLAIAWPLPARALAWLAPLAFALGLPFPLGLTQLAATQPALLPWAWGVNGCASVLSPLLAMLLAIEAGHSALLLAAALLYLGASRVAR